MKINLESYLYQGLAGELDYMMVVRDTKKPENKCTELISANKFWFDRRCKKLLKKLVKEYQQKYSIKDGEYNLTFNTKNLRI